MNTFMRFKYSFNPSKYKYFLKDRILNALIYLMAICLVVGGIQGMFYVSAMSESEKILEEKLESSELDFKFTKGVLELNQGEWMDESGENLLLVNTEKSLSEIDDLRNITVHKDNEIVFLKDGFMIKSDDYKMTYSYSEVGLGNESFDNHDAAKYLSGISAGKYLIIPYIVVIKYMDNIISALCVMLIGAVIAMFNGLQMRLATIFTLAVYSLTIPNIISIIFNIGSIDILIGSAILFIVFLRIKKEQIL